MALSITVNGAGTFTASMEEGPVSFTASLGAVGPQGPTGATGPTGVVAAASPITYDSGTQTVGISPTPTFTSVTVNDGGNTALIEPGQAWFYGPTSQMIINEVGLTFPDNTEQTTAFVGEARKVYIIGRNNTGTTIAKGKVVRLSGATGNKPTIALAQADTEGNSARTIGITVEAIADNADGKVIVSGAAENIDTSAFNAGDTVHLSASTAGGLVTALPTQPLHGVVVGIVTRANPSVGSIEVAINNYQELEELSDVLVSSKANNDLLAWDSTASVWKNRTFSALGLLTSATAASTYAPIVHTHTASQISDSTTAGRALLTAADAAAQRTSLGLGTMATETAANYALLASPTFTGDPKAPTPATSDNDTSIATTAFVNAYCPAATETTAGKVELATDAEAIAASSSTLGITARTAKFASMEDVWSPSVVDMTTGISGTGAAAGSTNALRWINTAPNALTAGFANRGFLLHYTSKSAATSTTYDGVQAVGCIFYPNSNYTAGSNVIFRAIMGRRGSAIPSPTYAVAEKSFGFEVEFNTTTPVLRVFGHNGTTLSTSSATFNLTNQRPVSAVAIKDGTTVRLYIDGTEVASTSGGPSGNEFGISWAQYELIQDATAATGNIAVTVTNPKVIMPVV